MAYLGVTASQALYVTGRNAPPALIGFLEAIRSMVPPMTDSRALGPEVEILTDQIGKAVVGVSATVDLEVL